jgi:alpha-L-fucosidase
MEIAALIHFNMASTHNCFDPSTFSPNKLDIDQWVESFQAFGAREAVLVAKHACGFCTWPSDATLPDGSRYPYPVAYSPWPGGKGDVVGSFMQSVIKAGMGTGYYYSLHQLGDHVMEAHNLSAAQIRGVEEQQLAELWGVYGNDGNLSEVWFDGGIDGPMRSIVKFMI